VSAADTILLGTKNGFLKLIKTITNTYTPLQINTGLLNVMAQKVCYYPVRRHPYYFRENNYFVGTKFSGIYGIGNPSISAWTSYNAYIPPSGMRQVSISPLNSNFVYAGGGFDLFSGYDGNGAVWKTVNASAASATNVSWTRVFPAEDTASFGKVITGIGQSNASTTVAWVTDSLSGVWRTLNGGTTWTRVYAYSGISCLYVKRFVGPQPASYTSDTIYVGRRINSSWYVFRSINGGTSFTQMTTVFSFPITSIVADSGSPQFIYATTWGGGVYKSTNGGTTFTRITNSNGTYNLNVYSLAVDADSTELTIGTEYGIYKSTDRGSSWIDDNSSAAGSGFRPDKSYGVFATRDTIWATQSSTGIYYRTKGLNPPQVTKWTNAYTNYGDGYAYNTSPYDTVAFNNINMSWRWNSSVTDMPIEGFALSEIHGLFRRLNSTTNIPFSNGRGIQSIDSIYVYIPDTCSAMRGEKVDIPVRIRNASYVDSFRVTIHVPKDYFISVDTTITSGCLVNGSAYTRYTSPTDAGINRWVFNRATNFTTNNDTVLFKVRYNIDNQSNIGSKNDSLPRSSNLYDSSIHLCGARLTGADWEDSTTFMWRSPNEPNFTHYGLSGTDDSIGVFWLRRLPDLSTNNNGLTGSRDPIYDDISDTAGFSRRGDQGDRDWGNANYNSDHDWSYVRNTGKQMTVYIKPSASPTYPYLTWDGLPEKPIRTGDAIGAFYYRYDSLVCAGWGIWRADSGCAFTIWGDDIFGSKVGFAENEPLNFKIYDSRYKKVWTVPSIYTHTSYGDAIFRSTERAEFDSYFQGKVLETMVVDGRGPSSDGSRGGWHLVSSYLYPVVPNAAVKTIFEKVDYFLLMKDQASNFYWRAYNIEDIIEWDITKAYWIYMLKDDYNKRFATGSPGNLGLFRGAKIDPALYPIPFTTGNKWYLIPYLGNSRYSVGTSLSSIYGNFTIVVDDSGAIYWPSAGIDQISSMIPGKGYSIYMNTTDTLIYPAQVSVSRRLIGASTGIPELLPISNTYSPKHFIIRRTNPKNQIFGIKIVGTTLRDGDEIGIFTKSGLCVGAAKYLRSNKNQVAVTVYGNDDVYSNDIKTGAAENEELSIRIYLKNDDKELSAKHGNLKWIAGHDDNLVFKTGSIAQLDVNISGKILPTEYSLEQNYPNPFNPTTNIKYSIPNDGLVKLKIYDLLGREVKQLVNSVQTAGYYTSEWDGTNNNGMKTASGIYFYRLESESFKKSFKMILMK
jgi:hypothetical protein